MEGCPPEQVQLRAEKRQGHQFLEGEADGRDILEAGQEPVNLAVVHTLRNQGVARFVNGIEVPVNGAAVHRGLFGQVLDGDAVASFYEADDIMHPAGLGVLLFRFFPDHAPNLQMKRFLSGRNSTPCRRKLEEK